MQLFRNLWSDERGEDVAEYALVLGLVAIVAVTAITLVGTNLDAWWNTLAGTVANIPVD